MIVHSWEAASENQTQAIGAHSVYLLPWRCSCYSSSEQLTHTQVHPCNEVPVWGVEFFYALYAYLQRKQSQKKLFNTFAMYVKQGL